MAVKFVSEVIGPAHIEAAIRWTEFFDLHPGLLQPMDPCAAGAESRPARAAEGKDRCICFYVDIAFLGFKDKQVLIPAFPMMTRVHDCTVTLQSFEPGAQQWAGLHAFWKDASGCSDKGFDTQPLGPDAQVSRGK